LSRYAEGVKLTAVFESWHIGDGNYPPLKRGQQVNLSFEINPSDIEQADSDQAESFVHLGGGEYEFTGTVLRIYADGPQDVVVVVSSGGFRFYINRPLRLDVGQRVRGSGTLLLDHYLWVEFLDRYTNPPDLFYQLVVERIRRVQIPESFVVRNQNGKTLPASLAATAYGEEHIVEIETMEGQAFDEEFYLLDLTEEGIRGQLARTFI
jgi:hypothetical protein